MYVSLEKIRRLSIMEWVILIVFRVMKTFNDSLYIENLTVHLFINRECKGGNDIVFICLEYKNYS